ncbi:MAG: inorganic diphosphatase [Burkholderiales bacterium]|nr:inorganic diphosphatase [Burkholderiales bacterium]
MRVFIENEAGSHRKNTYDERTFRCLSTVEVSAAYPFPYGFVPGTLGGDGDAVDCFVVTARRVPAGQALECDPVALLEQVEDGDVDHKLLAVPAGEPPVVDAAAVAALRHFAANVFAHVPGKRMTIGRLLDRAAAEAYLREAHARHAHGAGGETE